MNILRYFLGLEASALHLMSKGRDGSITCSDGIKLAFRRWESNRSSSVDGNESSNCRKKNRILCLHGWLDNAESFHILGPEISKKGYDVVALEFPGHGFSSHKSPDGPTQVFAEYVFYVAEFVRELNWCNDNSQFSVIGHSMGAGVSVTYAAAFPENVNCLILLEGTGGPLSRNGRDCSKHIRKACDKRMSANRLIYSDHDGDIMKTKRIYSSINQAIEARIKTASFSPGQQFISPEAAKALVERALVPCPSGSGFQFRHDLRLQWPSLQYMTSEQVQGLLQDVQCPTCLLIAEKGWPFDEELKTFTEKYFTALETEIKLPGSHHFHADRDTASQVLEKVLEFLQIHSTLSLQ